MDLQELARKSYGKFGKVAVDSSMTSMPRFGVTGNLNADKAGGMTRSTF